MSKIKEENYETEADYLNALTEEIEGLTAQLLQITEYRDKILELCELALTKIAVQSEPIGERLEEISVELLSRSRRVLN